jgi:hypothetical protein
MSLFDIVILAVVATGAALVIGGMILIGSGAIKLTATKNSTTTIKVLGDFLQLATTVPGIGLFLVGLAFEYISINYANQSRRDNIEQLVRTAVQTDRDAHAIHVSGFFKSQNYQDVLLTVCVGGSTVVATNTPFNSTIDLYSNYFAVKIESPGVAPEQWTVARSGQLPESYRKFSHTVFLDKGSADFGMIPLIQKVQLAALNPTLPPPPGPPTAPAGAAYGGGSP